MFLQTMFTQLLSPLSYNHRTRDYIYLVCHVLLYFLLKAYVSTNSDMLKFVKVDSIICYESSLWVYL